MSNICTPNIYAIHTATSHLQPLLNVLGGREGGTDRCAALVTTAVGANFPVCDNEPASKRVWIFS